MQSPKADPEKRSANLLTKAAFIPHSIQEMRKWVCEDQLTWQSHSQSSLLFRLSSSSFLIVPSPKLAAVTYEGNGHFWSVLYILVYRLFVYIALVKLIHKTVIPFLTRLLHFLVRQSFHWDVITSCVVSLFLNNHRLRPSKSSAIHVFSPTSWQFNKIDALCLKLQLHLLELMFLRIFLYKNDYLFFQKNIANTSAVFF